jgi:hypothetical protein
MAFPTPQQVVVLEALCGRPDLPGEGWAFMEPARQAVRDTFMPGYRRRWCSEPCLRMLREEGNHQNYRCRADHLDDAGTDWSDHWSVWVKTGSRPLLITQPYVFQPGPRRSGVWLEEIPNMSTTKLETGAPEILLRGEEWARKHGLWVRQMPEWSWWAPGYTTLIVMAVEECLPT